MSTASKQPGSQIHKGGLDDARQHQTLVPTAAPIMSATHSQETPVPGSLVLFDFAADEAHEVVLSPKPSNDINDPLNWSWKRKQVAHLMLVVCKSAGETCPAADRSRLD